MKRDLQPYSGGGGPTAAQINNNNNNLFLKEYLETYHPTFKVEECLIDIGIDNPIKGIKVNDTFEIAYDRWGYCIEGVDVDQIGIQHVVDILKESS